MQKIAYVFPGQGAQKVGMGRELYQNSAQAREIFEQADSVLSFPLSRLCFEGPESILRQTINAQPAILATSIAYLRAIRELEDEAIPPAFMAGHSLGEYTALAAAGVLNFADALHLARERGRLMEEAGELSPGGMAAVIGLEENSVEEVCQTTGAQIANINSPGQIVISGSLEALALASELAISKGARRVIPLEVSGAFHSQLMQPAAEGMSKVITKLSFGTPLIPIIANTTAQPVNSADAIKAELLNQLCHCVQWQRSVEYMIAEGVSTFIEMGPGQVLSGLIKRINDGVQAVNINEMQIAKAG